MEIIFLPEAKEDLNFWVTTGNKPILKKITELAASMQETPFKGIGKPEPLKHSLSGLWSRRISREHRLVYEVQDNQIFIHSVKGHYK